MCTSIVEIVAVEGAAKNGETWFPATQAVVAYDHPRHALHDDGVAIDFLNEAEGAGVRAAVELTLDSAKALRDALDRVIEAAEIEEGLRPAPESVRQAA